VTDLVVFAFDTETGAKEMEDTILGLQKMNLIELEDAAYVTRRQDGKVKVKQANSLVGAGAMGGAFWGMLIGLLFFMPWLGLVAGAVGGALGGKLSDTGIDDNFIKEVGDSIEPGQSALFLMIRSATWDKVEDAISGFNARVYQTSLSEEDEQKLKDSFGPHED
jgi:uncharacterized membrane protein